jgi:hypothetical protein
MTMGGFGGFGIADIDLTYGSKFRLLINFSHFHVTIEKNVLFSRE